MEKEICIFVDSRGAPVFLLQRGGNRTLKSVTGHFRPIDNVYAMSAYGQRDELETLRGHQGAVTMLAFSPTEPLLSSSSVDKSIDIWNLKTGRLVKRLADQRSSISAVAFRRPRIIATDRQAHRIYPQMIRLCSRFDSVLFTPKMSESPSYGNYSRSPLVRTESLASADKTAGVTRARTYR